MHSHPSKKCSRHSLSFSLLHGSRLGSLPVHPWRLLPFLGPAPARAQDHGSTSLRSAHFLCPALLFSLHGRQQQGATSSHGAQQMQPWPSSLGARRRPALLHGQVPWCRRPFPLVAAFAACVGLPAGAPPWPPTPCSFPCRRQTAAHLPPLSLFLPWPNPLLPAVTPSFFQQQAPFLFFPSAAARAPCSDSGHGAMILCAAMSVQKKTAAPDPSHHVLARSAQSRPAPSRWCLRQPHAASSICAALASRRQKSLVSPSLVPHCFWISSA